MFKSLRYFKPVLCASLLFCAAACNSSKKSKVKKTTTTATTVEQRNAKNPGNMTGGGLDTYQQSCTTEGVSAVTHFNYDSSVVLPEARNVIDNHVAKCLKDMLDKQPEKECRVLITGHCDKRNTREYNLALGSRRSDATKAYILADLDAWTNAEKLSAEEAKKRHALYDKSICTASKGKEELVDKGDSELAHARNRRAVIEIVDANC